MINCRKDAEWLTGFSAILIIPILALVSGCAKGEKLTPYPFKNGDYFVYEYRPELADVKISHIFRIESLDEGFVVRRIQTAESPAGERAETRIIHSEKVYDQYGRLLKLADGRSGGRCRGNFCFLWLKPDKRKVGAKIRLSEAAVTLVVNESLTRDNREVLVIHHGNSRYYYHKSTGLLVETKAFGKLIDTNRKDLL